MMRQELLKVNFAFPEFLATYIEMTQTFGGFNKCGFVKPPLMRTALTAPRRGGGVRRKSDRRLRFLSVWNRDFSLATTCT